MTGIRLIQTGDVVDIEVSGGEAAVGDTLMQEEFLVLVTERGEWKEHPLLGVGIGDMPCDGDTLHWKGEIMDNMERAGIRIKGVSLKDGVLEIKQ